MANNLVKFVYAASATAEQIAAFDSNTIYFVGNTRQLYKGSTLYDGGAANAAAELAELKTYIGTLPVSSEYNDLLDYIDKTVGAAKKAGEDAAKAVEDSLADVATSGNAADVVVADEGGYYTGENVEAVLAEIATQLGTNADAAAITVEKTVGSASDSFISKYVFKQGGNAITNGEITISKDLVATAGELVNEDGNGNTGTFIKMTIANGTPFYINVADLIEYNAVSSTNEIVLADTNHTISATVGEIAASKIIYKAASGTEGEDGYVAKETVAQAINRLETASSTGVDTKITAAIEALDSDIDATAGSVITGVEIKDGRLESVNEIALTADNVKYGTSSTVKAALDTIGAIPATATATTVVDYVDEKTGAGVSALNADVDAELAATDTDANAVAVISGVTEAAGVITAVDSVAVDRAGAATTAEANAKAYVDAALTWGSLA